MRRITKLIIIILSLSPFFRQNILDIKSSPISKGDVVINEINWSGSSLSSTDEWIELYNPSGSDIDLNNFVISGVGSKDIKISGQNTIIKSKDYYLISRLAENNESSMLRIKPDFVTTFSLNNSKFHIVLKNSTQIIDEINTKDAEPFAGESATNRKSSMAKISYEMESNIPESWKTSNNRINLDNLISNPKTECGKDYATPKSQNFSSDTNQTVFEFEESCFSDGEIKTTENTTALAIKGEKNMYNLFSIDHVFPPEASKYKVELLARLENSENIKTDLGKLRVKFDDQKYLEFTKINSEELESGNIFSASFLKPDLLTDVNITFQSNLTHSQEIYLDKLVIREIDSENTQSEIPANELHSFNSESTLDPVTNLPVKFLSKNNLSQNLTTVTENNFVSNLIDKDNKNYNEVKFRIKFANLNENLNSIDSLVKISIKNKFTDRIIEKDIRLKDITPDQYGDYKINFISETEGANDLTLISLGKSDIYLEKISTATIDFPLEETIDNLDIIETFNFAYTEENSILLERNSSTNTKVIGLNNSEKCFFASECEVSFFVRSFDEYVEDPDLRIGEIFVSSVDPDGLRKQEVFHLRQKDFTSEGFTEFKLKVPFGESSKLSLGFYSYNNSSIELQNTILRSKPTQSIEESNVIDLQSQNEVDWNEIIELKTEVDDNGFEGKLVDIIGTKKSLEEGNYRFGVTIHKLENFSSSEELISFAAYDETGKSLFENIIKEKDLSYFEPNQLFIDFSTTSSRKVFFEIKFYGNHFGAYSDLKLEGLDVEKI